MIILASTDTLKIVTSAATAVDVHASWVDGPSTIAPDRANTAISTATTTTVVSSPGGGVYRALQTLSIRNKSTTTANQVTVSHDNGTTVVELYSTLLGPGGHLHYMEEVGFFAQSTLTHDEPWADKIIGAVTTDPGEQMLHMQRAGNIAPTPTNIGTSIARCSLFVPQKDIVVNRIRWYGVGATTTIYRVALYRYSDLARLTSELAFTTVAATWGSVDAGGVTLLKDVPYFIAVSVNATGTTAGVGAIGGTIAAATGQVATAPGSLPGNMDLDSAYFDSYQFQFAVTTGALPNPAATLAAQAAWTGGMPAFWLDNNTAA